MRTTLTRAALAAITAAALPVLAVAGPASASPQRPRITDSPVYSSAGQEAGFSDGLSGGQVLLSNSGGTNIGTFTSENCVTWDGHVSEACELEITNGPDAGECLLADSDELRLFECGDGGVVGDLEFYYSATSNLTSVGLSNTNGYLTCMSTDGDYGATVNPDVACDGSATYQHFHY
jgi:hypothetical protein